jgi:hypothetical protein
MSRQDLQAVVAAGWVAESLKRAAQARREAAKGRAQKTIRLQLLLRALTTAKARLTRAPWPPHTPTSLRMFPTKISAIAGGTTDSTVLPS